MNLFRSEEHLTRWLHHWHAANDYVLSVAEWAKVFSAPTFRRRLEPDYLARAPDYLEEYRRALRAAGKSLPAPDRILSTVLFTDIVDSTRRAAEVGDSEWRALLRRHDDKASNTSDDLLEEPACLSNPDHCSHHPSRWSSSR